MVIYYYFSYTRFSVPVYFCLIMLITRLDDIPQVHSVRYKSVLLIMFFCLYLPFIKWLSCLKPVSKDNFTHYILSFWLHIVDFNTWHNKCLFCSIEVFNSMIYTLRPIFPAINMLFISWYYLGLHCVSSVIRKWKTPLEYCIRGSVNHRSVIWSDLP